MKRNELLSIISDYLDENRNHKEFRPGIDPVPVSGAIISNQDILSVIETALEGWFTEWKVAAKLSKELAKVSGKERTVLCNSGSSANLLAISTMTELVQSENAYQIITCATGFPTTVAPILQNGFTPLFVDADPETLNPKLDLVLEALEYESVQGVILAHTLGFPYRADLIAERCQELGKFFIEDICDAAGAEVDGERAGSFGDVSTLSMFPAHHITSGEGGAVFTNDEETYNVIRSYRDWGRACECLPGQSNTCGHRFDHEDAAFLPEGWDHKYTFSRLGYNLKITELQAALGLSQLKRLPDFVRARQGNYIYLRENLSIFSEHLQFPTYPENSIPSPFGFPISVISKAFTKKDLVEHLESRKVITRPVFAGNIVKHPMMEGEPFDVFGDLAGSNFIMDHTFWCGCAPLLSKRQLDYVIEVIWEFMRGKIR